MNDWPLTSVTQRASICYSIQTSAAVKLLNLLFYTEILLSVCHILEPRICQQSLLSPSLNFNLMMRGWWVGAYENFLFSNFPICPVYERSENLAHTFSCLKNRSTIKVEKNAFGGKRYKPCFSYLCEYKFHAHAHQLYV